MTRLHVTLIFLLFNSVVFAQKPSEDLNKMSLQKEMSEDDFIKKGIQKEKANDYKGALTDFNEALYLNPKNTEALYYRGYVKAMMLDYINALTDYDQAIAFDTASVELYYCRGNANFEMKNY